MLSQTVVTFFAMLRNSLLNNPVQHCDSNITTTTAAAAVMTAPQPFDTVGTGKKFCKSKTEKQPSYTFRYKELRQMDGLWTTTAYTCRP